MRAVKVLFFILTMIWVPTQVLSFIYESEVEGLEPFDPVLFEAANYSIDEIVLPLELTQPAHRRAIKAVYFEGSLWNQENIISQFHLVNKVYAQCGVQFDRVQLLRFEPPSPGVDYPAMEAFFQRTVDIGFREMQDLTIFFIKGTRGTLRVRGLGAGRSRGFAYPRGVLQNYPERAAYINSLFLVETVLTNPDQELLDRGYDTTSHELGHVLLDAGHVLTPNLMGGARRFLNGNLTQQQCETIISNLYNK